MKKLLLLLLSLYAIGCGSSNKLKKYYTLEDKTVFELLERLQKNASDKEALDLLPSAYQTALDKRKLLTEASYTTLPPGDRYMALAKEYGVMQQMYEQVNAIPAAKTAVVGL